MLKPIIILGPTAIGKTALSIDLAKRINGEIISSDSVQIYRFMDIGSAKPTKKERLEVKHHLIDIKLPDETFSSGEFVREAKTLIREINNRNKNAIIVGGGGFYIDSLVFGIDSIGSVNENVKRFFDDVCFEQSSEYLYGFLEVIDGAWARKIEKSDCQRIKRGLSVYVDKEKELSSFFTNRKSINNDFLIFVLFASRGFLEDRIKKRVSVMLQEGLIEEVDGLIKMGYANSSALKSIGYKESIEYLSGNLNKEELFELIVKNTKAYAKRQLTLLKSRFSDSALWIDVEKEDGLSVMLDACKPYL